MTDANAPSWKTDPRCDANLLEILRDCTRHDDTSIWNDWRDRNRDRQVWLQRARLIKSNLKRAQLWQAHLEGAKLSSAHLEGGDLTTARMEGAVLCGAHLEGADIRGAHLEGADFSFAVVDGGTIFHACTVDRKTDFTGVGLGACRIDPGLKQALEYNIRREGWKEWYKQQPQWRSRGSRLLRLATYPVRLAHRLRECAVRFFMWVSDYGVSTNRIILSFLCLAGLFAVIYTVCGLAWPPGMVANLTQDDAGEFPYWLVALRSCYFSVVTMTTLGFGDMFANARGIMGHLLLMIQVLLGYILLGVLIYRVTNLFQAGGPAGKALAMVRRPIRRQKVLQLSCAATVFAIVSISLFALEHRLLNSP